jgi:predicted acylesterase/phospholipase RssA
MNVQRNYDNRDDKRSPALVASVENWPRPASSRNSNGGDRVVTIAAVSDQLPDKFIAEAIAGALRAETGSSVLLIHLEGAEAPISLGDWAALHPQAHGEFTLAKDVEITSTGVSTLRVRTSAESDGDRLSSMVAHCSAHFRYILLHADFAASLPLLLRCFTQSDRTFLLVQPRQPDLYQRDLLLRQVGEPATREKLNVRTIICREQGASPSNPLLKKMGNQVHGTVGGCPSQETSLGLMHWSDETFNADIRRLAREVSHRRVGLALSSGGARGLAHLGVIQVLEENGIEVDVIAGCSMGSYVGAVWAYGFDGVAMERLAREMEHKWGLFELIDPFLLPRKGFLRGEKIKERLKRTIGDCHFAELVRPLRIVATHLATLDRVVLSQGEVASAVHASSAIPGACVPVDLDGERYIDGGIADPLPVDVLREMGIEMVIAVNTIPTPRYLRGRLALQRERDARRGKKTNRFKAFVNRYLNYFAPGNTSRRTCLSVC